MLILRVLVVMALSTAVLAGGSQADAQKGGDTGQSLIGAWQSEPGQSDDVRVTFRDDGTALVSEGSDDPGMNVRYEVDWSATPARIFWTIEGSQRISLVEFIDADRIRVTEPSSNPQSFQDEDPMVFARTGRDVGPAGPPPVLTEDFLVGVWSEAGERSCEHERVLFYDVGIMVAIEDDEDFEGTGLWQLDGNRLLLTVVEGESPTMASVEELAGTVTVLSPDSFEVVMDRFGERTTVIRCSDQGEAEEAR